MKPMQWLNYHHLYYFSMIVQEGGVAAAARKLRLTHSTLSAQLRALEAHLGAPLFERRGKRLVLTAFGEEAAGYAADIFRLGRELGDVARGRSGSTRQALRVGVAPGIPKALAARLLGPALDEPGFALEVRHAEIVRLLETLAAGRLHVVLTNDVPTLAHGTKLHTHALGENEVLLFASRPLARRAKAEYPRSLEKVPLLLPPVGAPLRRRLDAWLAKHKVAARALVEVDDAGLLRALGAAGRGVFPVRSALRTEMEELHGLTLVGHCEDVQEPTFAVTTERRLRHPGVAAIIEGARTALAPQKH